MPKSTANSKNSQPGQAKTSKAKAATQINSYLAAEINRLAALHTLQPSVLEAFAYFVIENHKRKEPKPLPLAKIKAAVYNYFSVKNTTELKKSGAFKMATDGIDDLNLGVKDGWEKLYRKFIGILPGEENQQGYGCINGINVFNYFKPWQVFGLDPKTATPQDIKDAYRNLSKIYHPDVPETGDAAIFDSLNIMYKSISAEA